MGFGGALPEALHEGFSTAMGQSILLPAAVILLGAAVALFFAKPKPVQGWGDQPGTVPRSVGRRTPDEADAAQGRSGARLAWRHPDQPSRTLVWMPPAVKPRLRAMRQRPLVADF